MKIEEGKYYRTRDGKVVGPIVRGRSVRRGHYWIAPETGSGFGSAWYEHGEFYEGETHSMDLIAEWGAPCDAPHIVAVVEGGSPSPGANPKIHPNHDAALAEARRLAAMNPGSEFAIYQRVSAVTANLTFTEAA